MIPCQACGNQNPMGTRFCRRCGVKIEFNQQQVVESVQRDNADAASTRWLERGRSMLIIGGFFLTCALVLRYAVVPAMPQADVPPVDVGGFLPEQLPKSAEAAAPEVKPGAKADTKPTK
jgi:hypothetical protein